MEGGVEEREVTGGNERVEGGEEEREEKGGGMRVGMKER